MKFLILAVIIMFRSGSSGTSPLDLHMTVRTQGYTGALCLTVDGPEFHRSCWVRQKVDPITWDVRFLLKASGVYAVIVSDKDGNRKVATVTVLGDEEQ